MFLVYKFCLHIYSLHVKMAVLVTNVVPLVLAGMVNNVQMFSKDIL